jgi:hypothetical protein
MRRALASIPAQSFLRLPLSITTRFSALGTPFVVVCAEEKEDKEANTQQKTTTRKQKSLKERRRSLKVAFVVVIATKRERMFEANLLNFFPR